ncbi:hypothetical protein [Rhodococcus marinonascens]|uniref:hypothetical protein n=1 Tax=Rhodococcus marinonascens TaxID=38311 RepID=UPI001473D313|nr:hypothetical protein [Rhodococcus marinonascens]
MWLHIFVLPQSGGAYTAESAPSESLDSSTGAPGTTESSEVKVPESSAEPAMPSAARMGPRKPVGQWSPAENRTPR